jgi:nicotinate-nucleotide--dimethylbenzimidazole phosphoribosyltransferase
VSMATAHHVWGAPDSKVRHNKHVASPIDRTELAASIEAPSTHIRSEAARSATLFGAPFSDFGKTAELSSWMSAVQGRMVPHAPTAAHVVIFAADHGVEESLPLEFRASRSTSEILTGVFSGAEPVSRLAKIVGAQITVVDAGFIRPDSHNEISGVYQAEGFSLRTCSGAIDSQNALTEDEAEGAFAIGAHVADRVIDSGADLLIPGSIGAGRDTVAAVVAALYTSMDPAAAVQAARAQHDTAWMRQVAVVRDSMLRGRPLKGYTMGMLAAVGGADILAVAGFLLRASARRVPVLLDGTSTSVGAMVAHRIAYKSAEWWLPAYRPHEPAGTAALAHLGLEPLTESTVGYGDGSSALAALPMLVNAAHLAQTLSRTEVQIT